MGRVYWCYLNRCAEQHKFHRINAKEIVSIIQLQWLHATLSEISESETNLLLTVDSDATATVTKTGV